MTVAVPRLIKVTFTERFPIDVVDSLADGDFMGLGFAYRRDDPRVLYVQPRPEAYAVLIEQLDAWKNEGQLSYVEESR
jgi:hypothetical protein